ncbi:MAG: peptidoglycan-binding protein [Ignavibacteria bacterium]|nr:peptidoglycan-binding protein [Ignavibacteria bacterium]
MSGLTFGDSGTEILRLQENLHKLGYYQGKIDGNFENDTLIAVKKFQVDNKLPEDGVADIDTLILIASKIKEPPKKELVTIDDVYKLFPKTPKNNIRENLPFILEALKEADLYEKDFVLIALAVIRAETESFLPINEQKSRLNSSPHGSPFDLYDKRKDLGNSGSPDGQKYRGRGFAQLLGKANYKKYGEMIGIGDMLLEEPEMANTSTVAARLLVALLKEKEQEIREALKEKNLLKARKLVNGNSQGYNLFSEVYFSGKELIE